MSNVFELAKAPDGGDAQITSWSYSPTRSIHIFWKRNTTFSRIKLGDFSADIATDGRKTLIFTPVYCW